MFADDISSHAHSLQTLNLLYEYDDFMSSVGTMCDMGCGAGLDLEWWATRTTRDDDPRPLNIICQGIDRQRSLRMHDSHSNIKFLQDDFESLAHSPRHRFDVIWCHDAFQYALDPISTLRYWRSLMNPNGMLVLILPQTTNVEGSVLAYDQPDYVYHNWTMVNLIHVLSVTGFDCSSGYFLKEPTDPWLHAVVYRSETLDMDPRTTRWYNLAEASLLPESAVQSLKKYGFVRQRDLVLPWLDRNHRWLGQA